MKWDYTKIYVDISMSRNVYDALHQFNHVKPENPKHQPYPAQESTYMEKMPKTRSRSTRHQHYF